jgi:hypothetical protein
MIDADSPSAAIDLAATAANGGRRSFRLAKAFKAVVDSPAGFVTRDELAAAIEAKGSDSGKRSSVDGLVARASGAIVPAPSGNDTFTLSPAVFAAVRGEVAADEDLAQDCGNAGSGRDGESASRFAGPMALFGLASSFFDPRIGGVVTGVACRLSCAFAAGVLSASLSAFGSRAADREA